jgi:hypothetical protein
MIEHALKMMASLIGNLRNAISVAVISSINDSGQAQTANVSTGTGVDRADVEVALPFGFSSLPPADGMLGILIAVGGDPSNLRLMPLCNPSARFGGLSVGESVLYAADSSRFHARVGSLEMWAPTIKVYGNLVVHGNITATGDITAGEGVSDISLLNHDHDYEAGPGPTAQTSPPVAGT